MKIIREFIAALNRHSEALEGLSCVAEDLRNAAFEITQASWDLESAVDNIKTLRVESEVSTTS